MSSNDIIGLLPAAGTAQRLRPFRYPKELLPVGYLEAPDGSLRPVLAAEYALMAMCEAGIRQCVIVVNSEKTEILKYFGSRYQATPVARSIFLSYVVQTKHRGLMGAIHAATPWINNRPVCLVLPDTLFKPFTAVSAVCEKLITSPTTSLVLGVFPTEYPHDLGPVQVENGRVVAVYDKPRFTTLWNTWGIAAWRPDETILFSSGLLLRPGEDKELILGEQFDRLARERSSCVEAVYFEDGSYTDLGTASNLRHLIPGKQ